MKGKDHRQQLVLVLILVLGSFVLHPGIYAQKAQGAVKPPQESRITLDTGGVASPLTAVLRALAHSAGYGAVIADIPEERRVVLRRIDLSLEEALRLIVGSYLGKDYAYAIIPERKLVVVGRRSNLEALTQEALKVEIPLGPTPKEASKETPKGAKEDKGSSSSQEQTLREGRASFVYRLPSGVDPESYGVVSKLVPVEVHFVRASYGNLLVLLGKKEEIDQARVLLQEIEAALPQPPEALSPGGEPPRREGVGGLFLPLPEGVSFAELEPLLRGLNLEGRVFPLGRGLYCGAGETICVGLGRILEVAFPKREATGEEKGKETPSILYSYPVYGDLVEILEGLKELLGPRLEGLRAKVYAAKGAKRIVVDGPMEAHRLVHSYLEQADPPKEAGKGEGGKGSLAEGLYRPTYVTPEGLAQAVFPRYPEIKGEVSQGYLRWQGDPALVRKIAKEIGELDRPKPQVVYRVIAFSTTEDRLNELDVSLSAVLRSGLQVTLGKTLSLGGVFPPAENASVGLTGALKLAEQKGYGKSLLNATVVAISGETSILQSGGTVSVLGGGGSSAPSQPGGGGNQPQPQPQPQQPLNYDYGLILKITPEVLSPSLIRTTVSLEISEEPNISGNVLRYTRKQSLGSYLIQPGGILVIGGVVNTKESTTREGIPILMDLPLLGPLFGTEKKTTTRENLLLYLIPETVTFPPSQSNPPVFRPLEEKEENLSTPTFPERRLPPLEPSSNSSFSSSSSLAGSPPIFPSSPTPLSSSSNKEGPRSIQDLPARLVQGKEGTLVYLSSQGRGGDLFAVLSKEGWVRLFPVSPGIYVVPLLLEYGFPYLVQDKEGRERYIRFTQTP